MVKPEGPRPLEDNELAARRAQTNFQRTQAFDEALSKLPRAAILARVEHFERCWKNRNTMSAHDVHASGTIQDAIDGILREGSDEAREYLAERFLTAAVLALFEARRAAGLTQTDLAERLGTKQPSISNLEADFSGSFSLRRYVDYLLACDRLPLDLTTIPADAIRRFLLAHPGEIPTESAYTAWHDAQYASSALPTIVSISENVSRLS